jgi:hypothetical protein
VAFHHAREDEVPQRAVGPPGDLEQEHGLGRRVVAVVGRRAAAVVVDRQADRLARRPDGLVVGCVERGHTRTGWRAGQQHATGEPVVGGPFDLGDRALDVVQHDLADAGAPTGRVGAEVGQPPVVGPKAGPASVEVAGPRAGRLVHERHLREERRDRVGEDHLGHDAVGLHLAPAVGRSPSCGRHRRRRCRRRGSRRSPARRRSRRGTRLEVVGTVVAEIT